ncbi:MAG: SRPBCC family protein [Leptolyngbyaceae cyanobacterium]
MSLATDLEQLTADLSPDQQQELHHGEVILTGAEGDYVVYSLIKAPAAIVWRVLTDYEAFPEHLSSVVDSRILERRENTVLVERKDRRKVGVLPIRVKIVTENTEHPPERIDYRMVDGTLDEMEGSWQLNSIAHADESEQTLLIQSISAKASMGPLQPYFFEVFESGLTGMTAELRSEMERQFAAQ